MVAGLSHFSGSAWIIPPFGSTCAILFGVPRARFSKPHRVLGGHLLAMTVGVTAYKVWGNAWWGLAIAVGVAIGLMLLLDVYHPPAGATPLLAIGMKLDWPLLFMPVLVGSLSILAVFEAYEFCIHKLNLAEPGLAPTSEASPKDEN